MNVTAAFDRAADYDRHAVVQRYAAEALAERILALSLPAEPRVLEIGCGTGFLGAALVYRLPRARWLMTDIAPAMVERARRRFAAHPEIRFEIMDGEYANADGPFDLICSSLAMQWFTDLPGAVTRLRALLAPQGRLVFATLAAGSLREWRQAHGALPCGIHEHPTQDELSQIGLEVTVESRTVHHTDAHAFLRALKAIGAGTPRPEHRPLKPAQLREVMTRFEAAGATATYAIATCLTGPHS